MNFEFPKKIVGLKRKLEIAYESEPLLLEIIRSAAVSFDLGISSDNWGGGTYGHSMKLYVPEPVYRKLGPITAQRELCKRIADDINAYSTLIRNEHIDEVHIDIYNPADADCREAIKPSNVHYVDEENLTLWKPGYVRLFISHKSAYKKNVSALANALEEYGISCFVAHEDIEPTALWLQEIKNALLTMDAFLAFITDDFQQSDWTDQETGIAYMRGVPVIPVRMESQNPYGFISDIQALPGKLGEELSLAKDVFQTICSKIDKEGKLQTAAIEAFANSKDFDYARDTFERLKTFPKFSSNQIERIVEAYNTNDQLYRSIYLDNKYNRMLNFIQKHAGNRYRMSKGRLIDVSLNDFDTAIPF